MLRTKKVNEAVELYERGFSCNEIAQVLGERKNTVVKNLRYRGVMREQPGAVTESLVARFLISEGHKVIKMPGDAPFDLLVNGERVDVKSACKAGGKYTFSLQTHPNKSSVGRWGRTDKDFVRVLDWFYFVFLDEPSCPIYALPSSAVEAKYSIGVSRPPHHKKYKFGLVGYLGEVKTNEKTKTKSTKVK